MAKKSKVINELRQLEQRSQRSQASLKSLKQKVENSAFGKQGLKIVTNPQGTAKMSDVLEAFIEPYTKFADSFSAQKRLLEIAIISWNLALLSEQKRQPLLDQVSNSLISEGRQAQKDSLEIINEMIERKLAVFAHHQRFILDFDFQDIGDSFHLSVVSTLDNPYSKSDGLAAITNP